MGEQRPDLSERIAKVLALDPSAPALEFERRWYQWGDLGAAARRGRAARRAGRTRRRRCCAIARRTSACCSVCSRAGACVVTANPERGTERVRADLESLGVGDLRRRTRRPRRRSHRMARWFVSDTLGAVDVTGDAASRRTGAAAGRRGRDAHERDDRSAEARPADLRDAVARVLAGAKHYERNADAELRLRSGVTIVNSPLVHLGGLFRILQCVNDGRVVLPARTVPRRRVGRRRAPPPPAHGQPRPGGAAHGARCRPRPGRPRERPIGRLRHGAARARRCRRVPREVRRAGADLVRRDRVRRWRRGMEPRRPRTVLGGEARQRRARAPRLRTARRRSRHRVCRSVPTRKACSR